MGEVGRDLLPGLFEATEEDVVSTIIFLAEGRLTEEQLARWIRDRLAR